MAVWIEGKVFVLEVRFPEGHGLRLGISLVGFKDV